MSDDGNAEYGYDQAGLNVELTDERALNGARRLSGYPLDVQTDGSWPGLKESGQVRVQPEQVKSVADWLSSRAGQVESLPQWLAKATSVSFGPSTWHEANNLKDASDMLSQAVAEFVGKTVANMTQAAGTLTAVHANYTGTEKANVDTVNAVHSSLGDGGGPKAF